MKIKILILIILVSCGQNKIPECPNCKIYAGDSSRQAMVREQDEEIIYSDSQEFDSMIGMTGEGFTAFVETYINGCEKWKTTTIKRAVDTKTYKNNWPQINKLIKKK